jgi:hypothetical protein
MKVSVENGAIITGGVAPVLARRPSQHEPGVDVCCAHTVPQSIRWLDRHGLIGGPVNRDVSSRSRGEGAALRVVHESRR